MEALNAAVDELVALLTGLIALYFFVSLVVNLAQAQLSTATGDAVGHAHALQQAVAMVILLAVAASSRSLVPALQSYLSPEQAPRSGAEALAVWRSLVRLVVSVVIGGTGIITTLSVVYAGLGAQASNLMGAPAAVSRAIHRFAVLIGGGILTFLSVMLANGLIERFF